MAFTGVTNAHGLLPQPTAFKPPTCSLMTATESTQAKGLNLLEWMGEQSVELILKLGNNTEEDSSEIKTLKTIKLFFQFETCQIERLKLK